MFDVGRWQQLDHEDIQPRIAHVMGNMLQAIAGGCQSGFCKVNLAESPNSLCTLHLLCSMALCSRYRGCAGILVIAVAMIGSYLRLSML